MHRDVLVVSMLRYAKSCCLDKSDCIAKGLVASRTNSIVMHRYVPVAPLRRCVITCCLDKSDRIDIETCGVFHYAAVIIGYFQNSCFNCVLLKYCTYTFPPIFFRAPLKQLFQKYPVIIQRRSETHSKSLCVYDLICPDSDFWHIGALKRLARLYALRYDLSCWWQYTFL